MPEEFSLDYLLHSASSSAQERDYIRDNWCLTDVVKKGMFNKFDAYVQESYMEAIKDKGN